MRLAIALILAALAATQPSAAAEPATEPPADPTVAKPASTKPAVAEQTDARELVAAIAPVVEAIRGLRFKKPVAVESADDAGARRHFEGRMATFWPETRMRVEQAAYEDLGLVPKDENLKQSFLATLEEQAGGYYDPARDAFVVLDDMPASMAPVIIAHELTHALDDQHFDIDGMLEAAGDSGERAGGIAAVVEGSGTLVMTLYIIREMAAGRMKPEDAQEFQESEAGQAKKLKEAPAILQRTLVGPYVLGMTFLLKGNLAGLPREAVPAGDLERAFRDPPVSWEQVLHPEKYWDAAKLDRPRPVPLPDLSATLGEGWALEGDGSLGELVLAILTDPGAEAFDPTSFEEPARWTNAGAAGWGGDRWQVYRRGARTVTVLATVWDSTKDARQFGGALPRGLRRVMARRGDAVVVVAGDAGRSGPALAKAALKAVAGTPR